MEDYARLAEASLEPGPLAYFAGGADDEWTLRENRDAFRRLLLRPRTLVDVGHVSTRSNPKTGWNGRSSADAERIASGPNRAPDR